MQQRDDDRRRRFADCQEMSSLTSIDCAISTSGSSMNSNSSEDQSIDPLDGINKNLAHLTFNAPSPASTLLHAGVNGLSDVLNSPLHPDLSPAGGAVLVDLFPNRDGTFTATDGDANIGFADGSIEKDKNEDYAQILPRFGAQIRNSLDVHGTYECKMWAVVQLRRYLSSSRVSIAIREVLKLEVTENIIQLGMCDCPRMQYEVCWILTNLCAGSKDQTCCVVAAGALPVLLRLFSRPSSPEVQLQACWCLGNIAGDSPELRTQLLADGVVESLGIFFENVLNKKPVSSTTEDLPCVRMFVWLVANVCRAPKSQSEWPQLAPLFEILEVMIHSADAEILVDAHWGLSRMLHGIYSLECNETESSTRIFPRISKDTVRILVNVLNGTLTFGDLSCEDEHAYRVRKPALRAVANAVSGDDNEIRTLVEAGVVPVLIECAWDENVFMRREALLAVSNIAAANEEVVRKLILGGAAELWYSKLWDEHTDDVSKEEVLRGLQNVATLNDPIATISLFAHFDWSRELFNIIEEFERNYELAFKAADVVCRLAITDCNIATTQNMPRRFLTAEDAISIESFTLPGLQCCGRLFFQIASLCNGLKSGSLDFLIQ